MSANFKHALVNYIRRAWWVWIFAVLFHLSAVVPLLLGYSGGPLVALMVVMGWNSELEINGWLRTMITLPLSRQEIGRLRWWHIVGVPGLLLSAVTLGLLLLFAPFADKPPTVWAVLELIARTWGALGILMLTGFLGRAAGAASMACLIVMSVPVDLMPQSVRPLTTLASGAGLLAAVCLYFRLAGLLPTRTIERPAPARAAAEPVRNGMSGWWTVIRQQVPVVATWIAMLAGFVVLMSVLLPTNERLKLPVILLPSLLAFSQPMIWIPAARVFRSLPMTAGKLAFALMLVTPLPAISLTVLCYAVGEVSPNSDIRSVIFLFCCATMGLPLGLRFGYRPVAAVLIMIPFVFAMVIAASAMRNASPTFIAIQFGLGAAMVALSWLWARHELISGVHAYRHRPWQPAPSGLSGSWS